MFWAAKTFARNGWFADQDRFEEQWESAGEPSYMLLVYALTPDFRERVFVGLPDREMLAAYPGLSRSEHDIPRNAKLLMGDVCEFYRIFPPQGFAGFSAQARSVHHGHAAGRLHALAAVRRPSWYARGRLG
jgi:hypothetical protein